MNQTQLRRAVQGLIKTPNQTTSNPLYNEFDLFPKFLSCFNQDAIELFKTKTNSMIHQYNEPDPDQKWASLFNTMELLAKLGFKSLSHVNPCEQMYIRKMAVVHNFGFTCKESELTQAAHKLIKVINDMASSKWLKASLYNLGMFELNSQDPNTQERTFVVFSYLAVDYEHERDVKATYGPFMFKEGEMPPEFK